MTVRAGHLRVDLHVHTAYSHDGFTTPEQLLRVCRRRGIDAIAVTDHDTVEGARYCQKSLPLLVILGEEITTRAGHLIGLFLRESVPPRLSLAETIARIREQDGVVYLPHPFDRVRSARAGGGELEALAEQFDVVEVFNSRNLFPSANRLALAFARGSRRLAAAASDAHVPSEVGRSHVEMAPFSSAAEFRAALHSARLKPARTPLRVRAWTKLRKTLRGVS